MANITKTSATEFIQTVWSGYILHAYKSRLGVTDRINRRLEDDAKFAAVINVNTISHLTVGDKGEGAGNPVSFEAPNESQVAISINKWKYVAFQIDDIVRLQSRSDLRQQYTDEIGYGLKRVQNTDITALFAGFSTSVGTLGQNLSEADRAAAYQELLEADVDVEGDSITWFLSPAQYMAWVKEEDIKNSLYMGSTQALREANIPSIYGAPLWMSNVIKTNGAGHDNALVHKDAVTLVQQMAPRIKSEWIIENIAQAVVADTVYGVGELRDVGGVWLKGL